MVEFGTVGPRAGSHVGEDPVAPGPLQRVPLQISGLVSGADPRVPVDHARHMTEPYLYPSMASGFGTLIAGRVMGCFPPECRRLFEYLIRCGPLLLRLGAITGFDGYCVPGPWLLRFEAMAG